ncbi:MAG: hypothetical protein IJU21_05125 [Bacteroidales bacterium]|nr:hypothetical protein [Bacteroidales bacterium]
MKVFWRSLLVAALIIPSCAEPYDDTDLKKDISDLQKKMEEVEKRLEGINSDISSLREIVTAIQNGKRLLEVNELTKDDETYWELVFSDGSKIQIHNGKDGRSPIIGVRQHTDGLWYWTLDNDWLLDSNGKKVKVSGTDGNTPLLDIKDGFWWVSYDNGSSWTKLYDYPGTPQVDQGPVEDIDTTTSSQYVIIHLRNGETINVPRYVHLSIAFGNEEIAIATPGATMEIPYTITGGTDSNVVKAFGQGGWIASVKPTDAYSGVIAVTAPSPIVSCEIIVLANDGAGYTALASLDCVKGEIRFAAQQAHAGSKGGNVVIPLETNLVSFKVETDAPWIHYVETKAFSARTVCLTVDANTGEERYASVLFKEDDNIITSIILFQDEKGLPEEFGVWTSTGEPVYAYDPSVAQMNLYEAAGQLWFRFVEPGSLTVREIGPIPAQSALKDSFSASYATIKAGVKQSSEEYELTVRLISPERVVLSTADNMFFVIRF